MKNLSIRLGKSLDHLSEQELLDMLGRPRRRLVDEYFIPKPSPGPQYVVAAADLTLLPANYLSTKICIMDFDQGFLTDNAPRHISWTPAPYLAPESIFTLTNGPAADVWALGCVLFNLRYPRPLFRDMFGSDPEDTAGKCISL
jgi:serine/threonine protein kinase